MKIENIHKLNPKIKIENEAANRYVSIDPNARISLAETAVLHLIAPVHIGPNVLIKGAPGSTTIIAASRLFGEILIWTATDKTQEISFCVVNEDVTRVQIIGANTLLRLNIGTETNVTGKNQIRGVWKAARGIEILQNSEPTIENAIIKGKMEIVLPKPKPPRLLPDRNIPATVAELQAEARERVRIAREMGLELESKAHAQARLKAEQKEKARLKAEQKEQKEKAKQEQEQKDELGRISTGLSHELIPPELRVNLSKIK